MALLGSNNPKLTAMMYSEIPSLVRQVKAGIIDELKRTHGDVNAATVRLKISRATLNRWIKKHPDLRKALNKIRAEEARRQEALNQ